MDKDLQKPVIALVWRPQEITSAVVDMSRRTGARAIHDISSTELEHASRALLQADASSDAVDLKISTTQLVSDGIVDLLKETGINTAWTEIHPALIQEGVDRLLDRIVDLTDQFKIFPVVGNTDLAAHIVNSYPQIDTIGLKGTEAAGFVGTETIFTLYSTMRAIVSNREAAPGFVVWGGIATPEATASFLAGGARGVVFESVHWLTDLCEIEEDARRKIASLRLDHTDLVGLNLGVPCRLFNKGNSRAVKELKGFAGSLCGSEIREEQRRFFAGRIEKESVHPLASRFERDELVPIGTEAAFAKSFAARFGSRTEDAVRSFITEVEHCLADAVNKSMSFVDSPVAARMGTRYPFIQGAMSWITDVPAFALKIAEGGGLPTVALGLMDKDTLENKLGKLPDIMGDRPYAVNVITLPENPFRDAQLAWIKKTRPSFAVIAAGEPSHGRELMDCGIEVLYIAPNEDLLKLALASGINYVICEGHEAGGHVGQHSTLTLAQMISDLKRDDPSLFQGKTLILAGGVFNRETAFLAAMLGADAIQMGTCYLTTEEIVETGALTAFYRRMILDSPPGGTVVTGEGTGLRVRSLKTARIEAICDLERDFAAGTEDEASFRRKIEGLSAGSLLVAARGLDGPGGETLDEERCLAEGQFMSGACAGALTRILSVEGLHKELAEGPLAQGLPFTGPIREAAPERPSVADLEKPIVSRAVPGAASRVYKDPDLERIAITGMAVVNSLGKTPQEVLASSLALRSGIVPVPEDRWDHGIYYDPKPRALEKTYCKVGAFLNLDLSRKDLGMAPQDFRTMTGATKVTLWLAGQAIAESGILESGIPMERVAVLISQNSGEAAETLQDLILSGMATDVVAAVKRVLHLTPDLEAQVLAEVKAGRLVVDDTTLLGRLNCSAGGFICNKYGFQGPSFSVSAACATALVALYSAVQMIRNGIIDAAVVGGSEEFLSPMHFLEFSALGALAGLSGVDRPPHAASRPFDAGRDGMVLGEGGGMIVIERESLARKRGAPIHAYITSMGASNNHLGMVESSSVTQEIAIGASFNDLAYGPESVDLVECHATSTMQGDVEEVRGLTRVFDSGTRTVLTSFKSQIGHTLGASGINSLVRGISAMNAALLPPTINYEHPDPQIGLEDCGFSVLRQPEDWPRANGRPRRLQVNAFGFGGSNYVVQVEQSLDSDAAVLVSLPEASGRRGDEEKSSNVPDGIFFFRSNVGSEQYRVAVVAESKTAALAAIESGEPMTEAGPIPAKRIKTLARQGIHLGPADSAPVPLAFVFPGQGSHYAGMGHELYQTFPVIREWMDRAAGIAEFDLLHLLFHDREEDLQRTRWQQPALFTIEYAMVQYLMSLGIKPTALAGHSLGELTALCLSGVYSFEDGFRIVNKRALCMDKACEMNVDPGIMLACDAPLDFIEEIIQERDKVYITNINSPRQVVLGGDTKAVGALGTELKAMGYRSTQLRVSMAFHSPIMNCIHDELEEFIAGIEFHAPTIPVISNTTMLPFPDDTTEIKRIVMAHLESPVQWMPNVQTLWNDMGVRLFVEVGPREILSNLILDTVEEADCIQTCLPSAESVVYRTAIAQLFAKGHLDIGREPEQVSFPTAQKTCGPEPGTTAAVLRQAVPAVKGFSAIEQIVQREISAFIVDSFGRFLKPGILNAVRSEVDPSFTEEGLDKLLADMFQRPFAPVAAQVAATSGNPLEAPRIAAAPKPVTTPVPAVAEAVPETSEITETVIQLIMEATGYERDEITPDMDLREDLSIRSSRLPVIMDAVEGHFKIKIEIEDFMDVRTISDIAERISMIMARTKDKEAAGSTAGPAGLPLLEASEQGERQETMKRVVFHETPLRTGDIQPVELKPMDPVIVFSAVAGTGLRREVGDVLRRDYGAEIVPMTFLEENGDAGGRGIDFTTDEGIADAVRMVKELEAPAGLVFIVDDSLDERLENLDEVSMLVRGFFEVLKAFVESPSRKFALLMERTSESSSGGRILAEGVLGMFLSATLEFGLLHFRTLRLDQQTNLSSAIRCALDRSYRNVETIFRNGGLFTVEGAVVPTGFQDTRRLDLGPDDVVVFSGGGYGITTSLARSLVPFGSKMIFLGRTVLEPGVDFSRILGEGHENDRAVREELLRRRPSLSQAEIESAAERIKSQLHIIRNVEELRAMGIEAVYYSCDVTDSGRTEAVMSEIAARYGKISGVVHGAGIIRDGFIKQLAPEDFSAVVDVKYRGASNLFNAARNHELKFFVCLSSAAAIQGNPGQSNYSAGNRIMTALAEHLRQAHTGICFKSLNLPPIEGAGMAEDPEIRALMKRMNASYINVEELGALFCRELFLSPREDVCVLLMRSLPDLNTVCLNTAEPSQEPGRILATAVSFNMEDCPLIDSVTSVDAGTGELTATRTFSPERDLWINDHKPFKFLRYPLVSAIMALEAFMEAARIMYPHLGVRAVRDARFLDVIECPPGVKRPSRISCRSLDWNGDGVRCEVSLSAGRMKADGGISDQIRTNYSGVVTLGGPELSLDGDLEDFPDDLKPLDVKRDQLLQEYSARSDMQGRYRVLESLTAISREAIRGTMIYREGRDFAGLAESRYQYSPYLLESLMQLASFYVVMAGISESGAFVPFRMGEVAFARKCMDGEEITIEGRLRDKSDEGFVWDARGVDKEGRTIMRAGNMVFKWFTP